MPVTRSAAPPSGTPGARADPSNGSASPTATTALNGGRNRLQFELDVPDPSAPRPQDVLLEHDAPVQAGPGDRDTATCPLVGWARPASSARLPHDRSTNPSEGPRARPSPHPSRGASPGPVYRLGKIDRGCCRGLWTTRRHGGAEPRCERDSHSEGGPRRAHAGRENRQFPQPARSAPAAARPQRDAAEGEERAATSGPVSDSSVFTGSLPSVANLLDALVSPPSQPAGTSRGESNPSAGRARP